MAASPRSHSIHRGAWSEEEDALLRRCVNKYGEGNWHLVPSRAGLKRCRKSCRLRWLNYLSPNINLAPFAPDEDDLIHRMHTLLGNRWSLIAGRLPGRTANSIKNRWNSHLSKAMVARQPPKEEPPVPSFVVVKPKAYRPTVKPPPWFKTRQVQTAVEEPAGNFTKKELFSFSSCRFDPMFIQRRETGGRLEAVHYVREESSLLPPIMFDLDGKESHFLPAATASTRTHLEWLPEILLDLDGKESSLQAAIAAPTQAERHPETMFDLDGIESFLQAATAAPTQAELEWLPETMLQLDGKESPLQATAAAPSPMKAEHQATTARTQNELEWIPEIFLHLDGKESSLQAATAAPTQTEFEWLPETLIELEGKELLA